TEVISKREIASPFRLAMTSLAGFCNGLKFQNLLRRDIFILGFTEHGIATGHAQAASSKLQHESI
ncbi:MAG: hypothetical protein JW844_08695, partial [Candidatus Omnitrophica bacterium]|nr:hypothetical protein [Candidatus Omnitrophota bacterium]